jgi:hypothetical protein
MIIQDNAFEEAKQLAIQGKEYAHLINRMWVINSDQFDHFLTTLDPEIANKTIYGMLALKRRQTKTTPKGRGRPRK